MKKRRSLWATLSLIFIVTFAITVSILYAFILFENARTMKQQEEHLLQATGRQLANDQQIQAALEQGKTTAEIQAYTNQIAELYGFDFVVVMDMSGIRLTHPDANQIGKHFEGGDELEALAGKESFSTSRGTLGESLRFFTPVYHNQNQIGVVAIGVKLTSLSSLIKSSRNTYTISLVISCLIGLLVAAIVSIYLKRQLHNLEPQEIYQLLEERNAMLEESKDAVFVIDLKGTIRLANIAATAMRKEGIESQNSVVGEPIQKILTKINHISLEKKTDQLYRQNEQDYLISSSPIIVNKQKIGYILFLRNATDSLFAIDQLANTTAYASALQSQSHEFMNKLHVIYGLVDLEEYNELKIYLQSILQPEKEVLHRLALLIKEPLIASFLIGERGKFSERKTLLEIEVVPEIPAAHYKNQANNLIYLYRSIHVILLQQRLPEKLRMTITYQENQLKTIYSFLSEAVTIDTLKIAFDNYYFKQLLEDAQGRFNLSEQEGAIQLKLTITYKGVRP